MTPDLVGEADLAGLIVALVVFEGGEALRPSRDVGRINEAITLLEEEKG